PIWHVKPRESLNRMKHRTETGTQLVLTAATTPWYPLTHAKSSAKCTRRAGVPCAEPIGRQEAPLRQGRRLRGVPAGPDRGAPAAPDPHPVLLRLVQPLALRRLAGRRRPDDGLLPLAGTHACDALEGRTPDRRVRSSVSGTVQELPGAERRTSVDRLAVHRADSRGGRVDRAGGALALERPVSEDAWRRCDQGHLIALAGGTPRGLDRSRECAAEREGIRARAGEPRAGPTFRRRRVGSRNRDAARIKNQLCPCFQSGVVPTSLKKWCPRWLLLTSYESCSAGRPLVERF